MSRVCRPANLASPPRIAIVSVAGRSAALLLLLAALNSFVFGKAPVTISDASGSSAATANSATPTITSLKLGFNGHYKVGFWTPLTIGLHPGLKNFDGQVRVETVDGDNLLYELRENVVIYPYTTGVRMLIKPGRPRSDIRVTLVDRDERLIADRTFTGDEIPLALLATQELIVEVGQPLGLARLQSYGDPNSLEKTVVALCQPADLAFKPEGLEGVDYIAIATSDKAFNQNGFPSASALTSWVRTGGKLILCVGRNGQRVSDGMFPLQVFLPGTFRQVIDRGPGAWESFTGAADPMRGEFGARPAPIATTVLDNVRGKVELKDGEIPVVIRSTFGFGQVLFIAADLDQAPFVEWPALGRLWLRILNRDESTGIDQSESDSISQSMRLGYTDLSGQLRSALDQFEGVQLVPFWLIALLGGGYVLLLFPVEYWLAGRARRYFEIAWITFPLLMAGSGALIYSIVENRKGSELRVNSIELVDVDLVGGNQRVNLWLSVFSPQTNRYDLNLDGQNPGSRLSWLGMPGSGLGGMNSSAVTPTQFIEPYLIENQPARLHDVPMASWSSKAFHAERSSRIAVDPEAWLNEDSTTRAPKGSLQNFNTFALTDCVLMYDGWTYALGDIAAGASVQVEKQRGSITINSFLTERRLVGDKEQATAYDPDSFGLARILRMMMFHNSVGARQYTSLSNRYYATLDMTDQLAMGGAVLIARGPATVGITIESSTGKQHVEPDTTIYRFVVPVNKDRVAGGSVRLLMARE